jgi:hypothetical protein
LKYFTGNATWKKIGTFYQQSAKRSVMPSAFHRSLLTPALLIFVVMTSLPAVASAQNTEQDFPYEFGIYYTAQKGETMVDIAKRFFDSEAYWPQLWNENDHIPNPYDLQEGARIRMYHKAGSKKIPLRLLSPKLPETKAPFAIFSPIDAAGFIRPDPVKPIGSLFKVTGNKTIIAEGDEVFLWKAEGNPFEAGGRYTVFRTQSIPGSIAPPDLGIHHYLTGVVEVTDVKPQYAVATVIRSYRQIKIDDRVMPYEKRSPIIPLARCPKGLLGTIVASEQNLELLGDGHIAFIDKGSRDGVAPGQQYLICERENRVNPNTSREVVVGPIDFGTMLVLLADERASTVVITQSDRKVAPGDRFRAPSLME